MIRSNLTGLLVILASMLLFMTGCSSNEPQRVNCDASSLAISFVKTDPTTCSSGDGTITATATGGDAPYLFAIDAQTFGSNGNFSGLGAGIYILKVKDKNECEKTTSVTLTSPNSTLDATIELTDSGCKLTSGAIVITATGGEAPYTYRINNNATSATNAFFNLSAGNYSITVSDDTGCSVTQSVKVLSGVKYSTDVKKIIDANCNISGCHDGSNISFKVLSNLQKSASDVKSRTQSGNMPKNASKLIQADLDAIACWVDDGAPDN